MGLFAPGLDGRRGLPFVLVGDPGTVKTAGIKKLARRAGLAFEGLIASLRMPTDFLGMPVPCSDGGALRMEYAPAAFAVRAAQAVRAVIFLDEFNTAQPATQAALLRVVLEGVVGELQLPPGVRFLLAMNETEDSAGGWEISPAMSNRLGWIAWEPPTTGAFTSYLLGSHGRGDHALEADAVSAVEEERAVDAEWGAAWAKASGEVAGFLSVRGELLHQKPKAGTAASSRAWCSARSWDYATHAIAGSYVYGFGIDTIRIAVSAWIGLPAFTEFLQWLHTADLPNAHDILDGKLTYKPNPSRLDRTVAVLTSCMSTLSVEGNKLHRAQRLWTLLQGLCTTSADITIPTVQALVRHQMVHGYPEAFDVLSKLQPMLEVADIRGR